MVSTYDYISTCKNQARQAWLNINEQFKFTFDVKLSKIKYHRTFNSREMFFEPFFETKFSIRKKITKFQLGGDWHGFGKVTQRVVVVVVVIVVVVASSGRGSSRVIDGVVVVAGRRVGLVLDVQKLVFLLLVEARRIFFRVSGQVLGPEGRQGSSVEGQGGRGVLVFGLVGLKVGSQVARQRELLLADFTVEGFVT